MQIAVDEKIDFYFNDKKNRRFEKLKHSLNLLLTVEFPSQHGCHDKD